MGFNVKVEIHKNEQGTFTNSDVISGVVKLTTTASLALAYIEVKLEGISTTQLQVPKRTRKNERREKVIQDVHRVLYETSIVFPPENIRLVSLSKEFTLTPGNYTYPFQFQIPLRNSCVKMRGVSNMVLFNKSTFDVLVNNGNFNLSVLRNAANNFVQQRTLPNVHQQNQHQQQTQLQQQQYHVHTQLPPTLDDMGTMANVRYFVKVTCKRSSLLKANLRAFDPFVFKPLDLDANDRPIFDQRQDDYKEVFFRKDMAFKDRLPARVGSHSPVDQKKQLPRTPQSKGIILSIFGLSLPTTTLRPRSEKPTAMGNSSNVPFAFELRFINPAYLVPNARPTFRLYFVSEMDPSRYSKAQFGQPEESNGLGVIYLQTLKIELHVTTLISVLESDGMSNEIHQSKTEEVLPLCNNNYQNLQFDLMHSKRQRSTSATSNGFVGGNLFELEIPRRFYENAIIPKQVAPTFHTCNITRFYNLSVVAGVSSEQISDPANRAESKSKIRYVDLFCPNIQVVSGRRPQNMSHGLQSAASSLSMGRVPDKRSEKDEMGQPVLPARPPNSPPADEKSRLPTYDDVVRENSHTDDRPPYQE